MRARICETCGNASPKVALTDIPAGIRVNNGAVLDAHRGPLCPSCQRIYGPTPPYDLSAYILTRIAATLERIEARTWENK